MSIYSWNTDSLDIRLQRVEGAVPFRRGGSTRRRPGTFSAVSDRMVNADGTLDLASSVLSAQGSIAPSIVDGTFGFTATTTSVTIYWDGTNSSVQFKLRRTDSQNQTGNYTCLVVPKGSITITGLSANRKYYFLPFWPTVGGCGVSWVLGDTGTPTIAFSTVPSASSQALQVLQNREALSAAAINYTTPAAGTNSGTVGTGGSTGSGGGFPCVMAGTGIEPIGDSNYSVGIHQQTNWIGLETAELLSLNCTPNHPLYKDMGGLAALIDGRDLDSLTEEELEPFKVRADELSVGDVVLTKLGLLTLTKAEPFTRVCTKRSVHMESGHLYWANNFMSHNLKANPE